MYASGQNHIASKENQRNEALEHTCMRIKEQPTWMDIKTGENVMLLTIITSKGAQDSELMA